MNLTDRSLFVRKLRRLAVVVAFGALLGCSSALIGEAPKAADPEPADKLAKAMPEPLPVSMHFRDGSHLKLVLRDERIEFVTAYGKLQIPIADIRQIDFGFHIDAATAKRVDAAIASFAKPDFKEREAASAELLALGEKAYPALLEATKHKDPEVVRRSEELLYKIRDKVPSARLDLPMTDVVQTKDSKITGRITGDVFKVKTFQFGEQEVKLGDLVAVGGKGHVDDDLAKAIDLPPNGLYSLNDKIGQTFIFKVTGNNTGTVWGSGIYTSDSDLGTAAVHAGVLKVGQAGVVKVMMMAPPAAFDGTTQNGITTSPYGQFPGAFQIIK
jgi:hypothetical protein